MGVLETFMSIIQKCGNFGISVRGFSENMLEDFLNILRRSSSETFCRNTQKPPRVAMESK